MPGKGGRKTSGTSGNSKRGTTSKSKKATEKQKPSRGEAVVNEKSAKGKAKKPAQKPATVVSHDVGVASGVPEQPVSLTHEQIRDRARMLWEQEGRPWGKEDEHWHQAEEQLKEELGVRT